MNANEYRRISLILAIFAVTSTVPVAAGPVSVARATKIPACTLFVDAATVGTGAGTTANPYRTIAKAVSVAAEGAVICVAEGTYAERLQAGTKGFTLAGGFQRSRAFTVRDSAKYVSLAKGSGGSFLTIRDPGPSGTQLTKIDGFEITGYSQAVLRDYFVSQRFDLTNNFIHDNVCRSSGLAGAGFSLNNVSGTIRANVFRDNRCDRGGARLRQRQHQRQRGHDLGQPVRGQRRHRARHLPRRGALSVRPQARDHHQLFPRQRRHRLGRRRLCRRLRRRRPDHGGGSLLERVPRQHRGRGRRRLLLRRRGEVRRGPRDLRRQLRRQTSWSTAGLEARVRPSPHSIT